VTISFYVLVAYLRRNSLSLEAGVKYLILGAMSTGFLVYGITWIFGVTGETNLAAIRAVLEHKEIAQTPLLFGIVLILIALGFKVAAAPFQVWVPDVYQGAPTPVTAFMASAVKAAAFAAMLRVLVYGLQYRQDDWRPVIWAIAVVTLAVGSVLAVVQTNVKRMLAYSSISHAGFILVGVQASSSDGTSGALVYLLTYAVFVAGTFGVVTLVGRTGDAGHDLDSYKGLGRRHPVLAFSLTIFLLAQAGVPLTSGFIAKFGVITAAVDRHSYALAIIAMLSAVIAAFVYLRIIVSMYMAEGEAPGEPVRVPASAGVAITLALGFTLLVGFLPGWLVDLAHDAVPHLTAAR
jgi:NADH-quinone oxidoreductase subunit N